MTTNEIQKCERDLANLEAQREVLFSRANAISKEREQIAHAALVGNDKNAKEALRRLNLEDASHGANIASVEAALCVARANLANAKHAAGCAADIAKAAQATELNNKLREELDNADDAFSDAITSVLNARKLLMDMHALGVTSPTDQMFRINSVAAIKTVLQLLPQPWINDFEFMRLAPSQKKSFRPLAAGWCDQIMNQIAARLPKKDAA
jgi:hypothetical protein